jgi:hypothetical protein
MNYISLIGVGIFILAWITYVVIWVIEVYRLFRTEPRMRPAISLSNFQDNSRVHGGRRFWMAGRSRWRQSSMR